MQSQRLLWEASESWWTLQKSGAEHVCRATQIAPNFFFFLLKGILFAHIQRKDRHKTPETMKGTL